MNINMTIISIFLAVIVILLLVIILMLVSRNKPAAKKRSSSGSMNRYEKIELPKIYFQLPSKIESMGTGQLKDIGKKVFESFMVFDYKDVDLFQLDKKEWHTWQVSILLMIYKRDEELFIARPQDKFHNFLLNASENEVKGMMKSILKKYENYVNISNSRDELSKDVIWTNKDVSIIFFFLTNYKSYS